MHAALAHALAGELDTVPSRAALNSLLFVEATKLLVGSISVDQGGYRVCWRIPAPGAGFTIPCTILYVCYRIINTGTLPSARTSDV